jgi:uncharacterized surface protein with fasciclin (FAS1) repeats
MKKISNVLKAATVALLLMLTLFACKRSEFNGTLNLQTNSKSILVLLNSDTTYTILRRALDTTQLTGVLNVYGSITLFAPTNQAFKKYFKRKGITGLSQMKIDTLKNILQYHLYGQTYTSASFLTGSLPTTTVEGDYIGMNISAGLKGTLLNSTVNVTKLDVPVTNGIVHNIDDVLEPPVNTIIGWLKTQPQYSIMTEAFQKTGLDASLLNVVETDPGNIQYGKPAKKMRTVFLETNDVLKAANINSFDDLAKKYSNSYNTTKAYTSPTDSLNIFIKYHTLNKQYFISTVRDEYQETYSAGDFLIFNISGGLAINRHPVYKITYNPVTLKFDTVTTNPFVPIDIAKSNVVAKNGIVNSVSSVLAVYNPAPVLVRVKYNPGNNFAVKTSTGAAASWTTANMAAWGRDTLLQVGVPWLKWYMSQNGNMNFDNGPFTPDVTYKYNQNNAPDAYWLELTTPQILKGKYDVYIIHANQNSNVESNVLFTLDGVQFGDLVNMISIVDAFGNSIPNANMSQKRTERKLGTVNFTRLQVHKFRQTTVSVNTRVYWYALEFRPVN